MATQSPTLLNDIRKGSAGVSLGRKLFDPSQAFSIQPTQITQILKNLGVNVPPSVQITADVAQMILAGGTVAKGISDGAKVGSLIQGGASFTSAGLDLLETVGILDRDSAFAQVMTIGLDAALVISSGGLNVIADVALVLDTIKGLFFPTDTRPKVSAQLRSLDVGALQKWYHDKTHGESVAAAASFADYHNGKVDVFQYIESVAKVAPDLFYNYFPQMAAFIPPYMRTIQFSSSGKAAHGGIFGIGRSTDLLTDTQSYSWGEFQGTQLDLETAMLNEFLVQPFQAYPYLSKMPVSELQKYGFPPASGISNHPQVVAPRIPFAALAILSLLPPYIDFIGDTFDIRPYLKAYGLTPFDLGINIVQDQMQSSYYAVRKLDQLPGLTLNGVESFTPAGHAANLDIDKNNQMLDAAQKFDKAGDIFGLLSIPQASSVIKEWGLLPWLPPQIESKLSADQNSKSKTGYRNIRNFWSAIGFMERMKKSPAFPDNKIFIGISDWLPSQSDLELWHKKLLWKVTARKLNLQARQNIATLYGKSVDDIKISPGGDGKLISVTNL